MESLSLANRIDDVQLVEDDNGKNKDGRGKNFGKGKKKINIEKIEKKEHRMVTFSKRRKGLFNKCREFYYLTGIDIAVIVSSPAGQIYAYGTPTVDVIIDRYLQSLDCDGNKENINEAGLSWVKNGMLVRYLLEGMDNNDDQDQDQDGELEQLMVKRRNLEKVKNELGKLL
ncbi:MADS-box transcription factor 51-like [Impatiens glandulifera]|uniref:MADS-box transcription factor 51-like n=1 Tax=Impatiens glandulifera TaxID=253017 RepID=UPI001FB05CE2|nr:MADS-box transcription factor 51-like [Impatiens glandulifera]